MVTRRLSHLVSVSVLVAALAMLVACATEITPPQAKIEARVDTVFGVELVDNYGWLRDRENPEVINYLKAENEYASKVMAHTDKIQDSLYTEMVARIKETDLSVPVRDGDYYYYNRDEQGKEYKIYCRKKGQDGAEEILLDLNQLAEGHDYMLLGAFEVSPSHQILAFAYDTAGNEEYTVRFKDLNAGSLFEDVITQTNGDIVWANDNRTLFYTTEDETYRPNRVWKHTLGSSGADTVILQEDDQAFYVGVSRTRSDKYILIGIGSNTTSEYWYLDADKPNSALKVIEPRSHQVEYWVDHHDKHFYLTTNADNAQNFKLVRAPVDRPGKRNWVEVIGHRPEIKLDGVDCFAEYMAIYERRNGLQTVGIRSMKDGVTTPVAFDEPSYSVSAGDTPEFNSTKLRLNFQSMVTPRTVYDYDMSARTFEMLKQTEVLGGYDPKEYAQERLFAPARDGADIPMSMVYKKALFKKDGSNPMYLYGYGAYGINSDPWFSSVRLSILDRGFVMVIAHVRGGDEMGRQWYDDGKLLKKKNTFTDFIDCADYLVSQQYTSHERMVISGGSAGGLLVGAVVNMRPDLAKIAVADVPFVDIINTMRDETIPLTVIEWEEWGNPHNEEYFHYMYSYSPYDQVKAQSYPHMLITAGLNDPRVAFWEPAKWTAKLRATKTDSNRLLFKTVMEGGHFGTSGRYARLKEIAFEYAFMFDVLGVKM